MSRSLTDWHSYNDPGWIVKAKCVLFDGSHEWHYVPIRKAVRDD